MDKVLVAMQPTVMPWAGYFNLMSLADTFIFYDDVQLEKQSWQTRNQLLFNGKAQWVSLPVQNTNLIQKINETTILFDQRGVFKLQKTFDQNYSRHPFFQAARELMDYYINCEHEHLSRRNESFIRFAAERLHISPTMFRSSELGIEGARSDRLINFCRFFEATTYLSPLGSAAYLQADRFAERSPSALAFQNFTPVPYPQFNSKEFVSHLSIIDVVANLGWDRARDYVAGKYNPI